MNKNIIRADFLYDHFAFLIRVSRLQKRYRHLKRHKIITEVILTLYYKETAYIILFRTKKVHYCLLKSLDSFGKLLTSKQTTHRALKLFLTFTAGLEDYHTRCTKWVYARIWELRGLRQKGKCKLSFMDCHIKIGQLEFWVIPLGVCDCDPALGAAHALAMEPTCVSTHRQLETAAFPQLITKSPCSASSKRNTENVTYPWHCLHTQERGGRPSKEFQAIIFISQSELTWTLASLTLEPTNTQLALPLLHPSSPRSIWALSYFQVLLHIGRFVYLGPGTAYAGPQRGGRKQIY